MVKDRFQALARLIAAPAICVLVSACSQSSPKMVATNNQEAKPAERIVSLAPSNTELLFAVGAGPRVVGVSTACDYPPQVQALPKAGAFMTPNMERISQMRPDLILLVSEQEAIQSTLERFNYGVTLVDNRRLANVPRNIRQIGELSGQKEKADKLAGNFEAALEDLAHILKSSKTQPRVLFCVWPAPVMVVGKDSFLHDVIETAGGVNITADLQGAYPKLNPEKLMLSRADVVILPPEAESQDFWKKAPWTNLPASKQGAVYVVPKAMNDMLSRPTPRLITGLAWLGTRLHPELAKPLSDWSKRWSAQADEKGTSSSDTRPSAADVIPRRALHEQKFH